MAKKMTIGTLAQMTQNEFAEVRKEMKEMRKEILGVTKEGFETALEEMRGFREETKIAI